MMFLFVKQHCTTSYLLELLKKLSNTCVQSLARKHCSTWTSFYDSVFIENVSASRSNWAQQQLGWTSLSLERLARDAAVVLEVSLHQSVYKPCCCLGITPTSLFPAHGHVGIPHQTLLLLVSCEWCGISFP